MGGCAKPEDCSIVLRQAEDIEKIRVSAKQTHDSTLRQEGVVKGLEGILEHMTVENERQHSNMFRRLSNVEVGNAKKLSAADIAPWVVALVSILALVWTISTTSVERSHGAESYHSSLGHEYAVPPEAVSGGDGRTVRKPIDVLRPGVAGAAEREGRQ